MTKKYTEEEVRDATREYFGGDELATNVFVTKYALQDKEDKFVELTPDDMHKRMAREFHRIEQKHGGERALGFDEIYLMFKDFDYIVPQGSPMYGIGNTYKDVSLSNCVVIDGPEDNMSSIVDRGRDLANLFKRRCGVGIDISKLRPEGQRVSNSAGTTSGAWSFADFYSYVCRMVGQNGRRGALMITLDVNHPDVAQFIEMKADKKAVTGANVSVKITDGFMEAMRADEDFTLQWPVDAEEPEVVQDVKARDLWELIVKQATENAEPGLIMWDNVEEYLPAQCYWDHVSTNPCSEIPLSPYDSCRLISINLKNFVVDPFTKDARFDFQKFASVVTVAMRLNDDLVDLELEALEEIRDKACDTPDEKALWEKLYDAAEQGRRTGLGTHGLADCLARLRLRYDGEDGLDMVDKIYRLFRDAAYNESINLAEERGTFPLFDWQKEMDNAYIQRLPVSLRSRMSKVGRRNVSILTCAPTGSVSIESQTSSGVEPVFRNKYTRRRKISHGDTETIPDHIDEMGDRWEEFTVYHHNVEDYFEHLSDKYGRTERGEALPEFFVTSDQIDWSRRVDLQAIQQRYIDHSISSTINLPRGTKPKVVGELYMRAWEKGLKGVTVYVEGSRDGVLVSCDETPENDYESLLEILEEHVAQEHGLYLKANDDDVVTKNVHLPDEFSSGDMKIVRREGGKYYLMLSYLKEDSTKDYPVAFWVHSNRLGDKEWVTLNRAVKSVGKLLVKAGVDTDLVFDQIDAIKDDEHHARLGKIISMALRHNVGLPRIIKSLEGIEGDYIGTTLSAVRMFLKGAVRDGTTADASCDDCGDGNVVFEEGCYICKSCGSSKCG
jgi:ribonucleoside-diphosphate reductase alpha chain